MPYRFFLNEILFWGGQTKMKKSFMKMCALILVFSILSFTFNFSAYGQEFSQASTTDASARSSEVTNTPEPTAINTSSPSPTPVTINIGDYVQMGSYYDEPILWRCVDIDENGSLMLADRILTIKPFDAAGNHKYADGTAQNDTSDGYRTYYGSNLWETSNMRCWLNSTATAGNLTWLDGCPPTADKVYRGWNAYANEKGFLAEGNFTVNEQNAMKSVTQKSGNGMEGTPYMVEGSNVSTPTVTSTPTNTPTPITTPSTTPNDVGINAFIIDAVFGSYISVIAPGYPTASEFQLFNGSCDITAITALGIYTITYPAKKAGDIVDIRLFASDGTTVITTQKATLIDRNTQTTTPTPTILYGDVNNDTVVDNKDLVLFKRYFAGIITSFINTSSADINNDGVVDNKDLVLVKRYFAGVLVEFPTQPLFKQ